MPWSIKDVNSHKKGLTPEQKKEWVRVANAVLKECLDDGGTDETCSPKAIRIANSKFSEATMKKNTENLKIQKTALCFVDHSAFAKAGTKEDGAQRKLEMVAYSGNIIKDHWYWGDLAIDVSNVTFAKKEIPILEEHDIGRKIGFGSFEKDDKNQIVAKDTTFVDTMYASEFIKLSDQGFPFEASIYGIPLIIQRLAEKEETEVNGFTMKGPGTVWRKSVIKECSITTFGADSNTKSVAMTENEDTLDVVIEVTDAQKQNKEEVIMDLEKLKAEFPELYAQILAAGKADAEKVFAAERQEFEKKIQDLSAENTKLTAGQQGLSDRLLGLEKTMEKEAALKKEQAIKMSAELVFSEAMEKANIPERLRSKIRKQVSHDSFVKNDLLDQDSFKAAIEIELKDWVSDKEDTSSILGMSFVKKSSDEPDVDSIVNRMLSSVGQTIQ